MALAVAERSCKLSGAARVHATVGPGTEPLRAPLDGFRMIQPKQSELSTDGLPKAFLQSLRTLFDILDDSGRGFVHISEIESRWRGAEAGALPGGVLRCLRRVAPPHGGLSFERFVAGLRCSMLNPDNRTGVRPQRAPDQLAHKATCGTGARVESRVRPLGNVTNTQQQHRTSSAQSRDGLARYGCQRSGRGSERVCVAAEEGTYRAEPGQSRLRSIDSLALESPQLQRQSVLKSVLPRSQSESATGFTFGSRRSGRSREEHRRHTISSGVDYELLKQMKELEQEKDSLLAGLEVVERAREWYQGQIHNVTERQRQVGQSSQGAEFFTDSSPSRMNVLIPKLQDVNRCLNELLSCTGTQAAPPGHTAVLSSHSQPPAPAPPHAVQRLKEQNRLLTQEVTEKSERIAQLEQEKSALIKQLFEARSAHDCSTMDSTFI